MSNRKNLHKLWHITIDEKKRQLQDIKTVEASLDDKKLLGDLLSTKAIKCIFVKTDQGNYLVMYDGDFVGTHTDVVVSRYSIINNKRFYVDMTKADSWILEEIWKYWMMPENTNEIFVMPSNMVEKKTTQTREDAAIPEIKHLGSMKPSQYENAIYSRTHSKNDLPRNRKRNHGTGYGR